MHAAMLFACVYVRVCACVRACVCVCVCTTYIHCIKCLVHARGHVYWQLSKRAESL